MNQTPLIHAAKFNITSTVNPTANSFTSMAKEPDQSLDSEKTEQISQQILDDKKSEPKPWKPAKVALSAPKLNIPMQNIIGSKNEIKDHYLFLDQASRNSLKIDPLQVSIQKQTIQIQDKDNRGNTPLHLAARNGRLEVLKNLLAEGAKQTLNENGEMPTHVARSFGHTALVQYLFEQKRLGLCAALPMELTLLLSQADEEFSQAKGITELQAAANAYMKVFFEAEKSQAQQVMSYITLQLSDLELQKASEYTYLIAEEKDPIKIKEISKQQANTYAVAAKYASVAEVLWEQSPKELTNITEKEDIWSKHDNQLLGMHHVPTTMYFEKIVRNPSPFHQNFFNAIAQGLNQLNAFLNHAFDEKELAKLCEDYILELDEKESDHWVKQKIMQRWVETDKENPFRSYFISDNEKCYKLYTQNLYKRFVRNEAESLWKQINGFLLENDGGATPEVEGRILCQKLGIKLHVITIKENLIENVIVDGQNAYAVDHVNYADDKMIHLVRAGGYDYEPLLFLPENFKHFYLNTPLFINQQQRIHTCFIREMLQNQDLFLKLSNQQTLFVRNQLKTLRLTVSAKLDELKDLEVFDLNEYLDRLEFVEEYNNSSLEEEKKALPNIKQVNNVDSLSKQEQLIGRIKNCNSIESLFANLTQSFIDIIRELLKPCFEILGKPPCPYAILGLGSLARSEMNPYSDLEFAIVIKKDREENRLYFRHLTRLFELQIISLNETKFPLLNQGIFSPIPTGFSLDSGGNTPLGKEDLFELIGTSGAIS